MLKLPALEHAKGFETRLLISMKGIRRITYYRIDRIKIGSLLTSYWSPHALLHCKARSGS